MFEEGIWLLVATSFEAANSVYKINDESNSFSITIQGHWNFKSVRKIIDELNKLVELRSENDWVSNQRGWKKEVECWKC